MKNSDLRKRWRQSGSKPRGETKFFSGSVGLISTARDYLHFENMLLNKGEFLEPGYQKRLKINVNKSIRRFIFLTKRSQKARRDSVILSLLRSIQRKSL